MSLRARRADESWALRSALLVVIGLGSCQGARSPTYPCPRPAFSLRPAAETLSVGSASRFAVGPELSASHGLIKWASSSSAIATVDQTGLATALSRGSAQIHAIDQGSPASCPDQWYGTLVVR